MKHLHKVKNTESTERKNTAFSIIDDKIQMLSHEYDRSCIVQNVHKMKQAYDL